MSLSPNDGAPAKHWHDLAAGEVLSRLATVPERGLSSDEVARRLAEHGANRLPEAERRPLWRVMVMQFASPLIYILFAAAVIAFAMDHRGDSVVILIVVILNAVIGSVQEGRAERSMESLRRLAALQVRVLRDGHERTIDAHDLVPGDIVLLAAGDAVGADARLFEAAGLEASEATLTGESLPVAKDPEAITADTPLADRRNMVYAGTHIAAGRGRAVVVGTGLATEVGRIAKLTAGAEDPKTPLELRIEQFGRYVLGAAAALFVVVLGLGFLRGLPPVDILMVAISQLVSMVPEGLPVAMTIMLAVGMQRMAKRGAIVRRLAAVETLGSTSVICSDKTGTLTKNEMTVTALWLPGERRIEVTGAGYSPVGTFVEGGQEISMGGDADLNSLLEAVALCNDSQLVEPDDSDPRWRPLGDPTEAALLTLAVKGGVELEASRKAMPRRDEIPFDSAAKAMATQHGQGARARVLIKGAPEEVLDLCSGARCNGGEVTIDESFRGEVETVSTEFGERALRLLAVAEVDDCTLDSDAGVAMGITGTEVAKGAAKIVVTDDNFATIVNAVEEGRLVYRNLKNVILYLFATSMAEVLVLLCALVFGYPLPLAAVQILWINIVTEGTVTVNLIMEQPEGDEMELRPIRQGEALIDIAMLRRVALMTPVMVLSAFGYYVWRLSSDVPYEVARSETFTVLAVCQWFNVLNCRSALQSALNFSILKNYWLLGGLALGNLLHFLVIYTEPLNRIFHTTPIPLMEFFLIGGVASLVLWAEEIRKFFARRRLQTSGDRLRQPRH